MLNKRVQQYKKSVFGIDPEDAPEVAAAKKKNILIETFMILLDADEAETIEFLNLN